MNNNNKKYYILHRGIITPEKTTTKLGFAYDLSVKTKEGMKILDGCFHIGLVILEDLCGLLLRFRKKKVGVIDDIKKPFLQIISIALMLETTAQHPLKETSSAITKK